MARDGQGERFGPTRRGGPVFRWLGMPLALDLANTVMVGREGEAVDLLGDQEALGRWLQAEREHLGDCSFAHDHLEEIRALRDAVRVLLVAAAEAAALPPEPLTRVNAASRAAPFTTEIACDHLGELRAVERAVGVDSLTELLGKLARAAIAVLTGPDRQRLSVCHAPSCGMVFLGDRTWCTPMCGNRARAARHYQRKKQTPK